MIAHHPLLSSITLHAHGKPVNEAGTSMKVRTFPVCGHEKALWELKTIESDPDATRRKRQTGNC